MHSWQRRNGFEISTKGTEEGKRYSALNAIMYDGRSLECHYQCDVKGFQRGGTNWRLGKGKPPVDPKVDLWKEYLDLWRVWALMNRPLVEELRKLVKDKDNVLSDCFASTEVNQAHALSVILTETALPEGIAVLNKHCSIIPENTVFIGRPSPWENIFSHLPNSNALFKVATRDTAVSSYEAALINKLRKDPAALARLRVGLGNCNVLCYCAPAKCHGDVLIWYANLPEDYCRLVYRLEIQRDK
jgi:hypothetical protein